MGACHLVWNSLETHVDHHGGGGKLSVHDMVTSYLLLLLFYFLYVKTVKTVTKQNKYKKIEKNSKKNKNNIQI